VCQRCGTQVAESGAPALVGAATAGAPASASTAASAATGDPVHVLLPFDAPPRPPLVEQRAPRPHVARVPTAVSASDTLVPHAPPLTPGPDNMLPPVRPQQTNAVAGRDAVPSYDIAGAVRVGVAVLVVAVLGFSAARVFDSIGGATTTTGPAYASALPAVIRVNDTLRTAVRGTRTYFLKHGSYRTVSASRLRHDVGKVSWVGGRTTAEWGQVSVGASSETTVVLASQVSGSLCAYARDDPIQSRTELAWDSGPCRASEAPTSGWSPAN
jgi:hypothetical protein